MLFTAINVDENSKDFEEMTEEAEANRQFGIETWGEVHGQT